MKEYIRYNKFSPRLLFVYVFGLVLLGFSNPPEAWTEPHVLIGVGLMFIGEVIRIWAAGHLRKNQELTTSGPYSYVKNPLYIGTILITVGTCVLVDEQQTDTLLDFYNWYLLGFAVLVFVLYYIPYKKKREGNRLHEKFGEAWEEYNSEVPDYVPRLTAYRKVGSSDKSWSFAAYTENSEHWTMCLVIVIVFLVVYKASIFQLLGLPVFS